jgi:hypothetical protein
MKRIVYFLSLLILVLGLGTVEKAIAVEIVVNGGFETGNLEPWVNPSWHPDKWNVVSTMSHSGNFSAYTSTGSSGGTAVLSQSFSPILVDDIASFDYWYYAETTSSPNLALGLWFSDGSYDQDFIWGILTNQWAFRDVMPALQRHSGKYLVKVGIYDTLQTDLYIDDVRLEAILECKGDFDSDGDVDGSDLAVFASDFGRTDCVNEPPCEGDFDGDGDVDGSDLAIFAADFGRTDCPGSLKIPYIKGYSNSGCLDMSYGVPEEYPGCGEDEIIARVEENSIFVTHKNATYNCCPDDIEVILSSQGNIVTLHEKEILTTPCYCLCCYNIYTEIAGLVPGEYTIVVCWQDWETHGELCKTVKVIIP